jgi:phosphatidylglycerophosphate synthase
MNQFVGWALAVLAVALGYVQWGWPGVALGISVIVFWLLLQFSRALRVMKNAGAAPVGHVDSAVMLHSKLAKGMTLMQVITLTRSLGRRTSDAPETFEWTDASGVVVTVELVEGRCTTWRLTRPADSATAAAD